MQRRIAGTPHRATGRKAPAHPLRAHLFVPVRRVLPVDSEPVWSEEDSAYLNASPLARAVVRLLMRFF